MRGLLVAMLILALPDALEADCAGAQKLVDQAFALEVRDRVALLESAARECPTFGTLEALGESYQAREEWDGAERSYAQAGGHLALQPGSEREHQQALLLYRSAQIARRRGQLCRAVAQFGEAARRFSGQELDQARAEMQQAESEWTAHGLTAADIQCSLGTQLQAHKDYCDGEGCRLFHDASVDVPVQFATDSAELSAQAAEQVAALARGAAPFVAQGYGLEITGHTDKRGSREHNYRLSVNRAHSVATSLAASLRLPFERIRIVGKGSDEPKYPEDTPEAERLNRRVEVVLLPAAAGRAAGARAAAGASGAAATKGFSLISAQEYAQLKSTPQSAQAEVPEVKSLDLNAPQIIIEAPDARADVRPPLRLDVRFKPAADAAIDVASFQVIYKFGIIRKDITDRIRPFVTLSAAGVIGSSTSAIPAGEHTLIIRIRDSLNRIGEQMVTFRVAAT